MELSIRSAKGARGLIRLPPTIYIYITLYVIAGRERVAGLRVEGEVAFHIHYIGSYLSQTGIALKYWPR